MCWEGFFFIEIALDTFYASVAMVSGDTLRNQKNRGYFIVCVIESKPTSLGVETIIYYSLLSRRGDSTLRCC